MPMTCSARFISLAAFLSFALLLYPCSSVAQNAGGPDLPQQAQPDPTQVINDLVSVLDALVAEKEAGGFAARQEYYTSLINFYRFQEDMRKHTKRVLWWQIVASYLILFLVVMVTGLGGFLSYREVMKAMAIGFSPEHKLDVAANRFQVTSAITGVVILVLSLFFLFLFVDRVFQINPVRMTDGDSLVSGRGMSNENQEPRSERSDNIEKESGLVDADGQPAG